MTVCGIVLAAGAGTRFGGPKALARTDGGEPWVAAVAGALRAAGCDPVVVVLGVGAERAETLIPADVLTVRAVAGPPALSASVRVGLEAAAASGAGAALLVPVDVPELPASACRRIVRDADADTLRQAVYRGRPGHPVLIGRAHWPRLARELTGDSGAGAYLRAHGAERIECADLWHGRDHDTPG